MMSRRERRARLAELRKPSVRAEMRRMAEAYPATLTPVPRSEWPERAPEDSPIGVWRSRDFLVQAYAEGFLGEADVVRLTAIRVTVQADGHWEQNITWEELQRIKRECGYADSYAVEVYPREKDVVRDCNMRHLWVLSEPLPIGWVKP